MKNTLVILIFSIFFGSMSAQDIIVLKDGTKIRSKVIEVFQDDIKYKKYENKQGPDYHVDIDIVKKIVYENGYVEDFLNVPKFKKREVVEEYTQIREYPRISYDSKAKRKVRFTIDNRVVKRKEVGDYVMVNKEAFINFEQAEKFHGLDVTSQIIGGISFFGIGVIGITVGVLTENNTLKLASAITGATLTAVFWVVDSHAIKKEKEYMRKAIDIYNNDLPYSLRKKESRVYAQFGMTNNGIGFQLRF